jgi:hypothetical protein
LPTAVLGDVVTGVSALGISKEWRNMVSMAVFEAADAIRRLARGWHQGVKCNCSSIARF